MIAASVPREISGLYGWWKADALALSDGAAVSSWTDSSGTGNNAVQATGANQPTFRANGPNGRPTVDFNGTSNFLTATVTSSDTFTIFAVASLRTVASDRTIIANGSVNGYVLLIHNPGGSPLRDLGYRTIIDNTGSAYTAPKWEIWCGARAPGAAGQGNLYVNGTSDVSTTSSIATPTTALSIGASDNGAANWIDGYISEIIFYTTLLTANQRAQVHTYLSLKYGIPTSDQIPTRRANSVNGRPRPFAPGIAR